MNILDRIVADLRPQLRERQRRRPLSMLQRQIAGLPPPPDFAAAFLPDQINIIAELKKASPSKGIIREDFNYCDCARELAAAGAVALSVLTEPNYFLGSLDYLLAVSKTVNLPLLCKDFIVEEYQIWEARLHGASAVLLIAALLSPERLRQLSAVAANLELAVLGEAHDATELNLLLKSGINIIGVNARNLKTFGCDLGQAEALLRTIPNDRVAIAESAIRDRADILRLQRAGARGFLIGKSLMRAEHPGQKLRELQ